MPLFDQVLKGATLFAIWRGESHRPTRDLDFLGYGAPTIARFTRILSDVCVHPVAHDDGLRFMPDTIRGDQMKEREHYPGLRFRIDARLGTIRIPILIDIGFGDAVTPTPDHASFPVLLPAPAPVLMIYPREAVVAEKYHAMVTLGIANSRMKDFYDVWVLAHRFEFDGPTLCTTIARTFERRNAAMAATIPLALTPAFATDSRKRALWQVFLRRGGLASTAPTLDEIIDRLREFLMPPTQSVAARSSFPATWPAGGPWRGHHNLR